MDEIIFQPLYESGKPVGYFISVDFLGVRGRIIGFDKCPRISNPLWRENIFTDIFTSIYDHIIEVGEDDATALSEDDREIYDMKDDFDIHFKESLDVADLYIYSHAPGKPGGYVRILTATDPGETGRLYIDESKFYPDDVKKAGPVEKFLYANADELEQYFRLTDLMKRDCGKYYWKFGDGLLFSPDIIQLYFNDTVAWNKLYWDLHHSIGRPWKCCNFIEAWRESGYHTERRLVAEHDSQRLLFWALENEYTLGDLRRMVSEKRIITKHFLGTKQDSWMTLEYGL